MLYGFHFKRVKTKIKTTTNLLKKSGTSPLVQWLRIHFVIQGTWVRSLVGELGSHVLQSN